MPRLCRHSPNPPRECPDRAVPDPRHLRPSTLYTTTSATGPAHHPLRSSSIVHSVDLKLLLALPLGPFPGPHSLAFDLIPPWISRLGLLLFRQLLPVHWKGIRGQHTKRKWQDIGQRTSKRSFQGGNGSSSLSNSSYKSHILKKARWRLIAGQKRKLLSKLNGENREPRRLARDQYKMTSPVVQNQVRRVT
ncbi:hypothetical protein ZWY2020_041268 [Hordeum vulgare]|nr:hypothetical protein ZWY2020_041268 [Hordeum vulgare]